MADKLPPFSRHVLGAGMPLPTRYVSGRAVSCRANGALWHTNNAMLTDVLTCMVCLGPMLAFPARSLIHVTHRKPSKPFDAREHELVPVTDLTSSLLSGSMFVRAHLKPLDTSAQHVDAGASEFSTSHTTASLKASGLGSSSNSLVDELSSMELVCMHMRRARLPP